jgi:hypothetical protein
MPVRAMVYLKKLDPSMAGTVIETLFKDISRGQ